MRDRTYMYSKLARARAVAVDMDSSISTLTANHLTETMANAEINHE